MNLIWKDIPEFETCYEVSNTGVVRSKARMVASGYNAVRSVKAKELKSHKTRDGYLCVYLSYMGIKKRKTLHQLVFAAFNSNFKYGQMLNHIDGNKINNTLGNLEFSNSVHNNTHAYTLPTTTKQGKSKYRNVSTHCDKRNKTLKNIYVASVSLDSKRHYIGSFNQEVEAAKAVDTFLDKIGDTLRLRNFP